MTDCDHVESIVTRQFIIVKPADNFAGFNERLRDLAFWLEPLYTREQQHELVLLISHRSAVWVLMIERGNDIDLKTEKR